ncbi:MAG TPA: TonB family protein [Blastocatellia bacterium]|nr:TonB family protein [Blastocatellia bacterium]
MPRTHVFIAIILILTLRAVAAAQLMEEPGVTELMQAARDGERIIAKAVINRVANVNARDSYGWTALIYASAKGDADILKALLDKGADVNAKSKDGYTGLHAAAHYGHKSVVKILLEKGADINAKMEGGSTPLATAVRNKNEGVAELLKKSGAIEPAHDAKPSSAVPAAPTQDVFTRAEPLNSPRPSYTVQARKNGIEGNVNVRILVGSDGSVKRVRILTGLPDGLSYQAVKAAYGLRFEPATKNQIPVDDWQSVLIEFHLRRD